MFYVIRVIADSRSVDQILSYSRTLRIFYALMIRGRRTRYFDEKLYNEYLDLTDLVNRLMRDGVKVLNTSL